MRMTGRVREIIEMNLTGHYIPLVAQAERTHVFPVYFARIIGESTIAIPVTGATGIQKALSGETPASALVVDRPGGYEAYLIEGKARYVAREEDFDFVMEMKSEAPGFPIHGAVVFEVEAVSLVPPP